MNKAFTAAQMRELDRLAIEEVGIPGVVLMENAGLAAVRMLEQRLPEGPQGLIRIFCGPGNNGGDGFVMARHLHNHGFKPLVYITRPVGDYSGDAGINLAAILGMGLEVVELDSSSPPRPQVPGLEQSLAVVDALFGTGLMRELRPWYQELLAMLSEPRVFRMAVDLPSGIHPDTGAILGRAFQADLTVTFGGLKLGLTQYPGREMAGEILVADISLPRERLARSPGIGVFARPEDLPLLPRRAAASYKNSHGHALVVAGSPGKMGAAILASLACLRGGAGLCTLASPGHPRESIQGSVPDLMVEDLGEQGLEGLTELSRGKAVCAAGPGLGTTRESRALVELLVTGFAGPLVLDADALAPFAGQASRLGLERRGPLVITPHPGELARLLGRERILDRIAAARETADLVGGVVVLKGAGTVVAGPGGACGVILSGHPALAKAGSGDVLTGLVTALLAQGMAPFSAALAGAFIHGRAGELVARDLGPCGLLASDLIPALGRVLKECLEVQYGA